MDEKKYYRGEGSKSRRRLQRCKIAESILQAVREKDELVHIAYGTIVKELKEVSRSYKEARIPGCGKIFFDERNLLPTVHWESAG